MPNMDRTLQEVFEAGVIASIPEKSIAIEVYKGKMSAALFMTCGDFWMIEIPKEDFNLTLKDINADYIVKQAFSQNKRIDYNKTYRK